MPYRGHLDHATEFELFGWAHHDSLPGFPVSVEIVVNRRLVSRVRAVGYRPDLKAAGYGDGHKSYSFNPFDYWTSTENVLEVYFAGSGRLVQSGCQTVLASSRSSPDAMSRMRAEAESRWTQDDDEVPPRSAAAEAGSAFWDLVDKHSRLGPPVPRVLEIGPGLGRLLRAMLERNRPFQSYHGVELNRGHVDRLRGEFLDTRISFQAEDCARYDYPDWYDAVVSSSTFEHLFPSITATVTRLRDRVKTGGKLFADYPAGDEQMTVARSRFADHPARHWVRTYSRAELEQIYRQAGFMIDAVELYPAATDTEGGTVRRAFVAATASAE